MGLSSVAFPSIGMRPPDLAAIRFHTGRLRRRTLDGLITAKNLDARGVQIVITTSDIDSEPRLAVRCAKSPNSSVS
jgi:hypothetical protein